MGNGKQLGQRFRELSKSKIKKTLKKRRKKMAETRKKRVKKK
jgi:hypothetical protein